MLIPQELQLSRKDLIFPENLLNFLQHLRLFFEKTQVFLKAQI